MTIDKNVIIVSIVVLILGLSIGYASATGKYANNRANTVACCGNAADNSVSDVNTPNGMHRMADGSLMGNGTMSMTDMMDGMNADLIGRSGDAFDKAFLTEMIVHHQGAVNMAQAALKSAKHQEVKDLARNIISAQEKEIAEMKSWEQAWYGN